MEEFWQRIRIIFIPYVLISALTIIFYSVLRWWLDIKLQVLPVKEEVLSIGVPIILAIGVSIVFFRRRVKILQPVRGDRFLYLFLIGLAITAPLCITQHFIETSAYNIVTAGALKEVTNKNRYYRLTGYELSKDSAASNFKSSTSGKYSENLNFDLYYAIPIAWHNETGKVWYAHSYSKQVSNRISTAAKQEYYDEFIKSSLQDFYLLKPGIGVKYFKCLPRSDARDGYCGAVRARYGDSFKEEELVILEPEYDDFSNRSGNSFSWIFKSLLLGYLGIFLIAVIPKFDREGLGYFKHKESGDDKALKEALSSVLVPRRGFFTPLLIDVNLLTFIVLTFCDVSIMSISGKELLKFGAERGIEVARGEYWRLLTAMFLHGGLMHLANNMVGLFLAGLILEPLIKPQRFLLLYFTTGVLAGITSIWWHPNVISVGASGALLGLDGAILALLAVGLFPKDISKAIFLFIGISAGFSLLFGLSGGIDNAAHVGGLVSGFVLGLIMVPFLKKEALEERERNIRKRTGAGKSSITRRS
ncbi:MAG: rhomboid family intramembrane serine protease [Bacteroidetes bacterium]|nr:rhomboid family intramembrane serine protease [Bacteroidota bacterium]